jgi:hypothetical protein
MQSPNQTAKLDLIDPDQDIREGIRISAVKYPPPVMMKVRPRNVVS